jgi:hypothetical protein
MLLYVGRSLKGQRDHEGMSLEIISHNYSKFPETLSCLKWLSTVNCLSAVTKNLD